MTIVTLNHKSDLHAPIRTYIIGIYWHFLNMVNKQNQDDF